MNVFKQKENLLLVFKILAVFIALITQMNYVRSLKFLIIIMTSSTILFGKKWLETKIAITE